MPTLVTPPKLLNSVLDLANGMIVSRVTAPFAVGTDVVVAVAARGVVHAVNLNKSPHLLAQAGV